MQLFQLGFSMNDEYEFQNQRSFIKTKSTVSAEYYEGVSFQSLVVGTKNTMQERSIMRPEFSYEKQKV